MVIKPFTSRTSPSKMQRYRACAVTLVLILGGAGRAGQAYARSEYDGNWSVLILTRRGACDPAIRYGVEINNGLVSSSNSGAATVRGRVSPRGAVRVNVQSGDQWASGSGRLNLARGSGAWKGQGTNGACSGTWLAQRRNYGAAENSADGPRYYNYYSHD